MMPCAKYPKVITIIFSSIILPVFERKKIYTVQMEGEVREAANEIDTKLKALGIKNIGNLNPVASSVRWFFNFYNLKFTP